MPNILVDIAAGQIASTKVSIDPNATNITSRVHNNATQY
jgi:hypothetical protein